MDFVRGKNMAFGIGSKVIACGRSCSLTTSTSFIETTTAGSGKGATFEPQKNTTTGSIEGVTFLGVYGKLSLPELRYLQLNHTLLSGYYERTDEGGKTYTDTIDFYISNITDTGSTGDFATFQMDIQVKGDPVIELTGCAPTNIEWSTTPVGPLQNIDFTWTPAFYADNIYILFSDDGVTYPAIDPLFSHTNDGHQVVTVDAGVYFVKFVTTGICPTETVIEGVGE